MTEAQVLYTKSMNLEHAMQPYMKACKQGYFIFMVCDTKKLRVDIKKILIQNRITEKRGVYTYKGIIVLTTDIHKAKSEYFDMRVLWKKKSLK